MVCQQTCKNSYKMDSGGATGDWQRLISYIHHTNDFRQIGHVGSTARRCRLGSIQDSDFAGDPQGSKSSSGGVLCMFGSRKFPPSVGCARSETSVSRSSTESEIISLDAGLRMDGLPALDLWDDLWDVVIDVLRSTTLQDKVNWPKEKLCTAGNHSPTERSKRYVEQLSSVDYVHTSTHSSQGESSVVHFLKNEVFIKMIIKGRSPTRRHVHRTHRVALGWLFDRINLDHTSKSNMLTPKTNLLTCKPNRISRVTSGTIFFVCSKSRVSGCSVAALPATIGNQRALSRRGQEAKGFDQIRLRPSVFCCLLWRSSSMMTNDGRRLRFEVRLRLQLCRDAFCGSSWRPRHPRHAEDLARRNYTNHGH